MLTENFYKTAATFTLSWGLNYSIDADEPIPRGPVKEDLAYPDRYICCVSGDGSHIFNGTSEEVKNKRKRVRDNLKGFRGSTTRRSFGP